MSELSEGKRYYFAATAYDLNGNESPFSNEVSHLVAVKDTDGDGLSDQDETQISAPTPTRADTDGDGLGDRDEVQVYKTDPTRDDTDGDGTPDGVEVSEGSNPLDPEYFPWPMRRCSWR